MFFLSLSFLAGISVVQQFSALPELQWLVYLCLLICWVGILKHWHLMFFTIGLLWAIVFSSLRLQDRLPASLEGRLIRVEGKIMGLPRHYEHNSSFDFAVIKATATGAESAMQPLLMKKIRLNWYDPEQVIKTGQTWQFTVKLKRPHGRLNLGSFDYERWLFMQNIIATGYIKNKPKPLLLKTATVFQQVDTIRQHISDKLDALLKKTESRGLIKALTIGDKQELNNKQWAIFKDTGTIHLLAISGLHIGLISALVYGLLLNVNIALSIRSPQVLAALGAIVIAIFYAALAGFSMPTQRALLMLMIAMVGIVWQRNIKPLNTLGVTLLAILIINPLAVLSAGFFLSFLAVVLIVYSLSARLGKAGYWNSAMRIHWITAMGLSPILLFYFQQVSIIAPLANIVAVPLVSLLVVPLCLLGVVMLFVSPILAQTLFFLVDKVLQGMGGLMSGMASLPFATISSASPPFYALVLAVLGIFILFSPKGFPTRWLALIFLLPLFFQPLEKPELGQLNVTVLDVGQGLSTIVQTHNHLLVFDTGAKYSKYRDMGEAVIIPLLKNKAIKTIDLLLISHGDNDHIGGANTILKQMQVTKIISNVAEQLVPFKATTCQAGQSWVWDQVLFEILSPVTTNQFASDNNNSCVLKIVARDMSVLLTGDIEAGAEKKLIAQTPSKLTSDVLVAPHHGSKTSSTLAFLQHIQAKIIVIPAGYRNRFSFPHSQVMERYKKMNATVFNTATAGAVTVKSSNSTLIVESFRDKHGKYWNN